MSSWRWIDPRYEPCWDAWVRSHPHAGPFHTSAWARTLHDAYGYRLHYAVIAGADAPAGDRPEGSVPGLVPVCEIDSLLTGRRGVCLPFADACVPLMPSVAADRPDAAASDADAGSGAGAHRPSVAPSAELLAPLMALARSRRWRFLELRGGGDPELPSVPHARYRTHELALDGGEDELFAALSSHHRRHVRRARRAGIDVTWQHDHDAVRTYYRLHCATRKRQGVPPQPPRFFRALHTHVIAPGHGAVALAWQGGRAIAGAVFVRGAATAVYKYGASLDDGRGASPNHLLMWEAIARYRADGCRILSFGRTDEDADGLAAFKCGFGAAERPLVYHRVALTARARTRARPPTSRPAGGAEPMGRRLFQAMPVPLLRLCGALLYRHVG